MLLQGADLFAAGLVIVGRRALRIAQVMPAVLAELDAAAHVGAHDAKGVVEHMQKARVIGVLVVLRIELPIVRQHLAVIAEHLERLDEDAINRGDQFRADVILEWGRLFAEGAENQAAIGVDAQAHQIVLLSVELWPHAALAAHALAEGDAGELAVEIVDPIMIDAGQFLHIASGLVADEGALVGAAIHQRIDAAILGADHDDRRVAHEGGLVVAGIGDLDVKAEKIPCGPLEKVLLLHGVDMGVCVDAIGRPRRIIARPDERCVVLN